MSQFYTSPPARGSSAAAGAIGKEQLPGSFASAAAPAPREGLPPCIRIAIFDGRLAVEHHACNSDNRSFIKRSSPYVWGDSPIHVGFKGPFGNPFEDLDLPDDPAEAEAAWERAERWVRTGVLDEG